MELCRRDCVQLNQIAYVHRYRSYALKKLQAINVYVRVYVYVSIGSRYRAFTEQCATIFFFIRR